LTGPLVFAGWWRAERKGGSPSPGRSGREPQARTITFAEGPTRCRPPQHEEYKDASEEKITDDASSSTDRDDDGHDGRERRGARRPGWCERGAGECGAGSGLHAGRRGRPAVP